MTWRAALLPAGNSTGRPDVPVVEGVWHMSGDDDGVWPFQYIAETRMKLGKDVADAMGEDQRISRR